MDLRGEPNTAPSALQESARMRRLLLGACLCVVGAACGGTSKDAPTPEDVDTIAAAVSDLV
jgi:hypothetical protein